MAGEAALGVVRLRRRVVLVALRLLWADSSASTQVRFLA
jgi:hypothetical protein